MKSPDPNLKLSSSKDVARTVDDWTTMFHLCLVILPPRPEANVFIPIARRIFQVFGDADCHTAFCVVGNEFIARGVLGDAEDEYLTFIDPDGAFVQSLGIQHLPAFVHLRQDTTLVAGAEGWNPREWQQVAKEIAKSMAWSVPEVAAHGDPAPTPGWAV
ncbi:MAG TPA: hypothetical protein VGA11_04840 [Acidimicrobiia bacterium]